MQEPNWTLALSRRVSPPSGRIRRKGSHLISSSKRTMKRLRRKILGISGGYSFLEHVTDALVEAWGDTLEEAFSQAGLALFETMLDTKSVHRKTSEEIQTAGHDEKELLYNYLEELLLLFEVKQLARSEEHTS